MQKVKCVRVSYEAKVVPNTFQPSLTWVVKIIIIIGSHLTRSLLIPSLSLQFVQTQTDTVKLLCSLKKKMKVQTCPYRSTVGDFGPNGAQFSSFSWGLTCSTFIPHQGGRPHQLGTTDLREQNVYQWQYSEKLQAYQGS